MLVLLSALGLQLGEQVPPGPVREEVVVVVIHGAQVPGHKVGTQRDDLEAHVGLQLRHLGGQLLHVEPQHGAQVVLCPHHRDLHWNPGPGTALAVSLHLRHDGAAGRLELSLGAGAHHGQILLLQDIPQELPLPVGGVDEDDVVRQLVIVVQNVV
uniref:Secreted protein n=1 Tax=Molossus molossus TaxID=27622 RepID=A0A7J8CZH1_MOLMO|nr:hypothetical protein HJG59_009534 [Molossus molossus]